MHEFARVVSGLCRAALMGCALVAAFAAWTDESRAASWLEKNFGLSGPRYDNIVPLCEDSWVIGKIQDRFGQKEGQYWQSGLRIAAFEEVREIALRPWHYASVPRRFCAGKVIINDGTRHAIYYSIIEDGGIIGATWGVEWCVVGLDRNWAYNPACKEARP